MELLKLIDDYLKTNRGMPGNSSYWRDRFQKAYDSDKLSRPVEPVVMEKIAKEFKNTIDYQILKDAYEWEVDIVEGYLWCLTAGDMGYEKTNFKLDVSNFST